MAHVRQPTAWPLSSSEPLGSIYKDHVTKKRLALGTRMRPGQCFKDEHSHITWVVRAMDSYFTLIRAHLHDTAVGQALYGQSRLQTPTLY